MSQRKTYIFGNWKLHKKFNEISLFFKHFNYLIKKDKRINKNPNLIHGFAPSHLGILPAINFAKGKTNILAQDVGCNNIGAFTGQVAFWQLNEFKINYAIVGHSETRKYLGNSDKNVNKTIKVLLNNNIIPVICIGESLKTYKSKQTNAFLAQQIKTIFKDISLDLIQKCIIAYEPLWAIGSGKTPTLDEIQQIAHFIRQSFKSFDDKQSNICENLHILYGGSANVKNASDLMSLNDIDGLLIGGASLDPAAFVSILKQSKAYKNFNGNK